MREHSDHDASKCADESTLKKDSSYHLLAVFLPSPAFDPSDLGSRDPDPNHPKGTHPKAQFTY